MLAGNEGASGEEEAGGCSQWAQCPGDTGGVGSPSPQGRAGSSEDLSVLPWLVDKGLLQTHMDDLLSKLSSSEGNSSMSSLERLRVQNQKPRRIYWPWSCAATEQAIRLERMEGAPLTQVQSTGQAMGLNFQLPRNALTYSIRMEIIPKMSGKRWRNHFSTVLHANQEQPCLPLLQGGSRTRRWTAVWLTQGRNVEFTFCRVAFFHS